MITSCAGYYHNDGIVFFLSSRAGQDIPLLYFNFRSYLVQCKVFVIFYFFPKDADLWFGNTAVHILINKLHVKLFKNMAQLHPYGERSKDIFGTSHF